MCLYVGMRAGALEGHNHWSPWARVTSVCESPQVVAGSQAQVLWKGSTCSSSLTHRSSPLQAFFRDWWWLTLLPPLPSGAGVSGHWILEIGVLNKSGSAVRIFAEDTLTSPSSVLDLFPYKMGQQGSIAFRATSSARTTYLQWFSPHSLYLL